MDNRTRLCGPIRRSMKLDTADRQIKKQCILEGELLVWDDRHQAIEPFYKIHRHVQRSGQLLGYAWDPTDPTNPTNPTRRAFDDRLL
jgi:DNA ligase-4